MKISEILNFSQFYDSAKSKKLSFKTAYKLSKLNEAITKENEFYQTSLSGIINEYGQKDEEGQYILTEDKNGVKLIEGKEEECFKKVSELDNLEVTLPEIKFTVDEFEGAEISPEEIGIILPFIEE